MYSPTPPYSLTPPRITHPNISEPGLGQAILGQTASNENRALPDGFYGDSNSGNHLAYVTGQMIRTAYAWLASMARTVGEADAALRFPVAGAAPVPLFQTHGNILRTFEMPPELELHPKVTELKDPLKKPDLSGEFHDNFAEKLEKTIHNMPKDFPFSFVSDIHETGRSRLMLLHLLRLASEGKIILLLDGVVHGQEAKRLRQEFKEDLPVGGLRGLESDVPSMLTELMGDLSTFSDMQSKLQSKPASDLDKKLISRSFTTMLTRGQDSEAFRKAFSDFTRFAPLEEKAPIQPFFHAMGSHVRGAKNVGDYLAEWYVNGNAKDKKSVTLFLERMMRDIGKSLNKEDAGRITHYLEDPENRQKHIEKVSLTLRNPDWDVQIGAACKEAAVAYKKTGIRKDVVVFGGSLHEEHVVKELAPKLMKKAGKPKEEMKSEL